MTNGILQSFGLDRVNINMYAKYHHNIPLSSRDMAIFTFIEFRARQSLYQWQMSFCNHWLDLVNINVIKIFQTIQELWHFSQTGTDTQGNYRAYSESQPSAFLLVYFSGSCNQKENVLVEILQWIHMPNKPVAESQIQRTVWLKQTNWT